MSNKFNPEAEMHKLLAMLLDKRAQGYAMRAFREIERKRKAEQSSQIAEIKPPKAFYWVYRDFNESQVFRGIPTPEALLRAAENGAHAQYLFEE